MLNIVEFLGVNVGLSSQVVPDELVQMAERYESWRERKESERGEGRGRGGFGGGGRGGGRRGGGFGGGGRRDRNMSSFI